MLRSDLLMGCFESVEALQRCEAGELIRVQGNGAGCALLYVPDTEERGRREREMLALLAGPGVPVCDRTVDVDRGVAALVLAGAQDARPLHQITDLPAPTLRAGLVTLLSALSHVHSRGFVHGRISRASVLADPSGAFWITAWADAQPAAGRPAADELAATSVDLRDLGAAFLDQLLARPWDGGPGEPAPPTAEEEERLVARMRGDRDFVRVMARLVGSDPREAYTSANEVLADLGSRDSSMFDPWECVPLVGRRAAIRRVLHLLDHTRLRAADGVEHVGSVDFIGPHYSGKSRLLAEIGTAARARGVIVLSCTAASADPWGGVGTLVRRLLQTAGSEPPLRPARLEALRAFLEDRPAAPRRGSPAEPADERISAVTMAVTELTSAVFRRMPALLLMDDEDQLEAPARSVWRALGRYLHVRNEEGAGIQLLLVSTTTRALATEPGTVREIVELADWDLRDVRHLLVHVLSEGTLAHEAGAHVHRICGGRPGETLGYLRELERTDALVREGLRWRLEKSFDELPPWTGGIAEHTRRALAACTRDAVALTEVLAVSGSLPIDRATCGRFAELNGPRLFAAAESALQAGLLTRSGASWRTRTEAIRVRVYATLSDDRRKALHRELLVQLLDTAPDALDPIATHARASHDPRAPAWTAAAADRAEARGDYCTAIAHLEGARTLTVASLADATGALRLVDLLRRDGRIPEGVSLLEDLTTRETRSQNPALSRAWTDMWYSAHEWERLLAVSIPETQNAPDIFTHIRYRRALAYVKLGHADLAAREARLAQAELGTDTASIETRLAELEWLSSRHLAEQNYGAAITCVVHAIRQSRRAHVTYTYVQSFARLANLLRMANRTKEAYAVLKRAQEVLRSHAPNNMPMLAFNAVTFGYLEFDRGRWRRTIRCLGVALATALRSGSSARVTRWRLSISTCRVLSGQHRHEDKALLLSLAPSLPTLTRVELVEWSFALAHLALFFGHQRALETACARAQGDMSRAAIDSLIVARLAGKLWHNNGTDVFSTLEGACQVFETMIGGAQQSLHLSVVACAIRRGWWGAPDWPEGWGATGLIESVAAASTDWGARDLAVALLLWAPVELTSQDTAVLEGAVGGDGVAIPVALQWQRTLLNSRKFLRAGAWRRAQHLDARAREQLRRLAHGRYGTEPDPVCQWGVDLIARTSLRTPAVSGSPRFAASPPAEPAACHGEALLLPASWRSALRVCREHYRTVVISGFTRELQYFGTILVESVGGAWETWQDEGTTSAGGRAQGAVIMLPDKWRDGRMADLEALLRQLNRPAVALMGTSLADFRRRTAFHAAAAECMEGVIVALPPLCESHDVRGRMFQSAARRAGYEGELDSHVLGEVTRYNWPGGLAELERVAAAAVQEGAGAVQLQHLMSTGWDARLTAAGPVACSLTTEIMRVLRQRDNLGIADVCGLVRRPRRTVLRVLQGLVADGRVTKAGKARATRYLRTDRGE